MTVRELLSVEQVRKELAKLVEWLRDELKPDVVILTNVLLSGIVPDIKVENARLTTVEEAERVKEKDLTGHLANPVNGESKDSKKPDAAAPKSPDAKPAAEDTAKLSESDYQLYEALNLLKALNVLGKVQQATNR